MPSIAATPGPAAPAAPTGADPGLVSEIRAPSLGRIRAAIRALSADAAPGAPDPGAPPPEPPRVVRQDRRAAPEEAPRDLTSMLFTTRRVPLYALPVAKSGCTWLKNLLWLLDHPDPHPDPLDIHRTQEQDLVRPAGISVADVAASPYGFVLVRHPADRFASLFFDKVASDHAFPWLRERLCARGAPVLEMGADAELHGQVFDALLEEVAASVARRPGALALNPHWRPQSTRLRRTGPLRLRRFPVDMAERLVHDLLRPAVPEIAEIIARVPGRNAAPRLVARGDVLTPARKAAIEAIYPRDLELYSHALRGAERFTTKG